VEISRKVERSLLGGIENDPLSQATALLGRRWETDRAHAPTHGNDVIILRSRIQSIDLAVVDLVFKFLKKRRGGRKRKEKFPCDQRRPTRISD